MMWYQVIEIRNLEPLKIGAGGNKAHWDEPCKDYIPGSTLRGGAIARMQRLNLFGDSKSVLQHMECSNAYLYQNGQLYLPSPNIYVWTSMSTEGREVCLTKDTLMERWN